jgi:hypothetical protein
MRLLRPLLAAAVVLAAAAALPAQAHITPLPEATSTTIVTAAHSGYLDLVLPDDVRMSPRDTANPDVSIVGEGRVVGLWLSRGTEFYGSFDDYVEAVRYPAFLHRAATTYGSLTPRQECQQGLLGVVPAPCNAPKATAILLHEGRYRLTVLTDGHPLTLTLHLHGLEAGTTTLSPTHRLASAEQRLPARDGVGDTMVTYGATQPFAGPAAELTLATATRSPGATVSGASTCSRRDTGAPPPLAYGPHCPNGTGSSSTTFINAGTRTEQIITGSVSTADGGDLGLGGAFTNTDGVTLGQTLGVWLAIPA